MIFSLGSVFLRIFSIYPRSENKRRRGRWTKEEEYEKKKRDVAMRIKRVNEFYVSGIAVRIRNEWKWI